MMPCFLPFGDQEEVFDLVENDDLSGSTAWGLSILTQPDLGNVRATGAGRVEYSLDQNLAGDFQFQYILCNAICPDFCDTATVFLSIQENLDAETPDSQCDNT